MGKMSLFASGLALGGVVALAAYIALAPDHGGREVVQAFDSAATQQMAAALRDPMTPAPAAPVRATASAIAAPCAFDPLLAPTSAADQQFDLRAAL
ncbi:MAG TPA: hypothetical protein VFE74_01320, partial [Ramlibacter sp.]|nr:hypothetical protein [Ramlibacter sp.]